MARWPSERGTWVIVGLSWTAGTAPAALGRGFGPDLLLGAAIFCGVMAREPLVWSLWRRTHKVAPSAEWRRGAAWAAAALVLTASWWHAHPLPVQRAGLALALLGVGWDSAMRLVRASAWWPGVAGSACTSAGVYLAALATPLAPATWLAAAGIGYAVGCTMCAMGVYTSRVPRSRPAGVTVSTRLLWGWSAGGGVSLAVAGMTTGCLAMPAVALGMGLLHAELAHEQPRTLDFRRLGWQETVWLATVVALILWMAGWGPTPAP